MDTVERGEFSRTMSLLGEDAMQKLWSSRVAIFGVGGVGGYVVEGLARSGVGNFDLIDNDIVSLSNINRQIIATRQTVGRPKVEVMKERILSISRDANVQIRQMFYLPDEAENFDFGSYDYIVDAIDTITAKIDLIIKAKQYGTPIISAMGAGNKLSARGFEVADIYQTSGCPLARIMRKELKARGVEKLKVVYSKEIPKAVYIVQNNENGEKSKKLVPSSIVYMPAIEGMIMASEVIADLTKDCKK